VTIECTGCGNEFERKLSAATRHSRMFCSTSCYRHHVMSGSSVPCRKWSRAVRARAHGRCESCGSGVDIGAHHIYPIRTSPLLRSELANGVALCRSCHGLIHQNPVGKEINHAMQTDLAEYVVSGNLAEFDHAVILGRVAGMRQEGRAR
jgi:hypothetical protein